MSLPATLTDIWNRFQGELFPELAEEVGELHTKHRRLVELVPEKIGQVGKVYSAERRRDTR